MFTKPNPNSGIPIYVQVKEQIIHAVEKGAVKVGDQLPSLRSMAEELVINPNTVLKIYRELEVEGIVEIRHGLGAFVANNGTVSKTATIRQGTATIEKVIDQLINKGLTPEEIRRIVEAELQKRS